MYCPFATIYDYYTTDFELLLYRIYVGVTMLKWDSTVLTRNLDICNTSNSGSGGSGEHISVPHWINRPAEVLHRRKKRTTIKKIS